MKILITTPIWPPEIGGPVTYIKELINRLPAHYQPSILAFADNPEDLPTVPFASIGKRYALPMRQFRFLKKIMELGKKADLIYAQNPMAVGVPSVLASRFLKKPLVLKFVGDNAWESAFRAGRTKKLLEEFLKNPDAGFKNKLRFWVQRWVFQQADKIIVPSDFLGRILSVYYQISGKKITTIYNASESEDHFDAERTAANPHQIVSIGRLVPWKDVGGIIEATKILSHDFPQIKLVIAGDGPERKSLETLTASLHLREKVTFLGNISKKETAQLRKQSGVFVLNSLYEGLPHTVLSSFAVGIPVIATNIPGTDEALLDGQTGLTVPIRQPQVLAEKIRKILTDKELAKKLTLNAKKLLEDKFSWPAHLQSLENIFESVVSEPAD